MTAQSVPDCKSAIMNPSNLPEVEVMLQLEWEKVPPVKLPEPKMSFVPVTRIESRLTIPLLTPYPVKDNTFPVESVLTINES